MGPQVNGSVYSLLVQNNYLWIGGNFTLGSYDGLGLYDLNAQSLQSSIGVMAGMYTRNGGQRSRYGRRARLPACMGRRAQTVFAG